MSGISLVIAGFRGPYCTYVLPTDETTLMSTIRRAHALCAITEKRLLFAKHVVQEKIQAMTDLNHRSGWGRSPLYCALEKATETLPSLDNTEQIMGLEGALTRRMYDEMSYRLPKELSFTGRNRRPPLDPVNACISYSNSILYALCVPPLARAGLNTAISFLHEPGMGRHSLALDMTEGLKPLLSEGTVLELVHDDLFTPSLTEETESGCFLVQAGRKAIRETMNNIASRIFPSVSGERFGWTNSLWNALEQYAKELAQSVLRATPCQRWRFLNG